MYPKWGLRRSDARVGGDYVRSMKGKLLSKPTRAQLRRDFWRLDEPRLFVRKAWGRGWTVNFARLFGRRRAR